MPVQHPTIILNPASGQGDPQQRHRSILRAARGLGWQGKLIKTTPDKLATYAAEMEYQRGQRSFIICGGDGTIIEAIEALVNKKATIGIVPLGTGNLLAKNLNLPLNIPGAMEVALRGKSRPIDIGQANQTYFAIMAGMGLDAEIMRSTSRQLKNMFGLAAYYWTGVQKISRRPTRFHIEIDGAELEFRAKTILVANMGKFAGQFEAVPHARPDDGALKIGVIKASTFGQLADVALAAMRGNANKSKYYTLLEGKQVTIRPVGDPQPYQCDGNDYPPAAALNINIHHHAIKVIGPNRNYD
jgi:diacylglycerol kinase (ATP)